jgi:hypothetical protein
MVAARQCLEDGAAVGRERAAMGRERVTVGRAVVTTQLPLAAGGKERRASRRGWW